MPPKRGTPSVRPVPSSTSRKPPSKPITAAVRGAGRKPPVPSRGGAISRGGAARPGVKGSGQQAVPGSNQKDADKEEKKRTPTIQELMAIRIQTAVRAFLSRKYLRRLMTQKAEYDELMDRLQREAYVQLVKMERLEAERQAEREAKERRRKQQLLLRKKGMLEAAFDGEVDEIKKILLEAKESYLSEGGAPDPCLLQRVEFSLIECTDANNLTPLSEAAAGGSLPASCLLVETGADPNSIGQYGRTPLYRAAFAGRKSVCEYLLNQGADPRIFAEDGSLPQHVASSADVEQLFLDWDVEETERMMAELSAKIEERKTIESAYRREEIKKRNNCIEELDNEFKTRQLELATAHQELEKRILEHDTLLAEGMDRSDLTLPAIHDAEGELEMAKLRAETARQKLQESRLTLRESDEGVGPDVGVRVNIRELDEVLMRDVGNKIKDSGKWPLIIDPSSQVSIFLKYRDTNYIDLFNPKETSAESARLSLLGSIRFGKMLVIDMRDVDMWSQAGSTFNQIQPGLFDAILSADVLRNQSYMSLVRAEDGEEYQKVSFMHGRVDKFRLIVLTKMPYPPEYLLELLYPITIVLPQECTQCITATYSRFHLGYYL